MTSSICTSNDSNLSLYLRMLVHALSSFLSEPHVSIAYDLGASRSHPYCIYEKPGSPDHCQLVSFQGVRNSASCYLPSMHWLEPWRVGLLISVKVVDYVT